MVNIVTDKNLKHMFSQSECERYSSKSVYCLGCFEIKKLLSLQGKVLAVLLSCIYRW